MAESARARETAEGTPSPYREKQGRLFRDPVDWDSVACYSLHR